MSNKIFDTLNYTLGNEDSSVEYELLSCGANHVVSIAGSGSRVIPLLAKYPKKITIIDTSPAQLALTELRVSAVRDLNYQDYLTFFGYKMFQESLKENINRRKQLFESIEMSDFSKKYLKEIFLGTNWQPILYVGKWERTFYKLNKILKTILGTELDKLLEFTTVQDQTKYLRSTFPQKRWKLAILVLGNATVFNKLMYKGHFPKKNFKGSYYRFYLNRLSYLLNTTLVKDNFFLQLLLLGKLAKIPAGILYLDKKLFQKAQESVNKTNIIYKNLDIFGGKLELSEKADFVSLSDTVSYLGPKLENKYLQYLKDSVSPNGLVVARHYLRNPPNVDLKGFENITEKYCALYKKELVNMYDFGVFRKK